MSRRYAHSLIANGTLPAADVEEALQRQVVFGGSLDTNLIELGALDEKTITRTLGEAFDLPTASKEDIDRISPHVPRLFPLPFAETYHLVPYQLDNNVLHVLINGEPDERLFARIHERLKLHIAPVVTSEIRMHYAMNALYGAELLPRFRTMVSRLDGTTIVTEPAAAGLPGDILSWGLASGRLTAEAARGHVRSLSLRELLARLEFAADRDSIVDILLGTAVTFFDFCALFLVQQDAVTGWRGKDVDATRLIARLNVPLDLPSVFQTIYATRGHYLGPLPQNSINRNLLKDLNRDPPRAALLAPIIVGDKLAVILYADNARKTIPPKRVAAILLLAQRVGVAFERLIRKRKAEARQPEEPTVPPALPRREAAEQEHETTVQPAPHADSTTVLEEEEFELLSDDDYEHLDAEPASPVQATRLDLDEELVASSVDEEAGDEEGGAWEDVSFGIDESPEAARGAFESFLSEAKSGKDAAEDEEDDEDDGYVAFADVGEGDEASLGDWTDVLVDAAEASMPAEAPKPRTSKGSTITWEHVIAEAESATTHVPKSAPTQVEVAGQVLDEREILLDGLDASDPGARRSAIEKLLELGGSIDEELGDRFPGSLEFDPFQIKSRIPPFDQCSGLCALLAARGASAASVVLPHLESDDPTQRFFAIYFLLAVKCPEAVEVLARRLYDREPRNRHLAVEALRAYSREPAFQRVLEGTRGQLKVPVPESQIAAVQILGQLRDPASVPLLIPLVVAPNRDLAKAAASSLAVLCAQGFAYDVAQWADWWRANYNRPRPAWLIGSLRHPDAAVRRVANHELQLMTGRTTHFDPDASDEQREKATQMWEAWWKQISEQTATAQAASAS